jgi:hypothetical protein
MFTESNKKRARESRTAIEKIYVNMRHLFNRGSYKPNGLSGQTLKNSLLMLSPEIYGAISDPARVELDGLNYVMDRLPRGIEECRYIKLIAREGFEEAGFETLIPPKRRRNCYRIDEDSMYIEMTRGRSDIYDILTHLTFVFNEAEKIKHHALDGDGKVKEDWTKLEAAVLSETEMQNDKQAITYLSNMLGRTYRETSEAVEKFKQGSGNNLFHVVYWLGKRNIDESLHGKDVEITFSTRLRENIGHHIYGEYWATDAKSFLQEKGLLDLPIHIISANLHSVMNTIYAPLTDPNLSKKDLIEIALESSKPENEQLRQKIKRFALKNGMAELPDQSGTNLGLQIIETQKIPGWEQPQVIIVMDYAFGEQAFECMDELLKPFEQKDQLRSLNIRSISIMGKAGILYGDKGDLMIPNAHVFEGTADNYPFTNDFNSEEFQNRGLGVYEGTMITVLGTSLQNKDVLQHFKTSTWNAVGIEMEGAHYQKAIQSAVKIRKSVPEDLKVRYAYYASDNPLLTGKTLASGSLGPEGVKPTYLITQMILDRIREDT